MNKTDAKLESNLFGQRQGFGTYSLCLGQKSSSQLYLEFPGEWNENQLILNDHVAT
jgi:hypothetical protein